MYPKKAIKPYPLFPTTIILISITAIIIPNIIQPTDSSLTSSAPYQTRNTNSPITQRGPVPGLNATTPYCFFYGRWDDGVIPEIIKKFRLVIAHLGVNDPWITFAQVARLKEAGVIVIGYWPIAEDYTSDRPGDGSGPVVLR